MSKLSTTIILLIVAIMMIAIFIIGDSMSVLENDNSDMSCDIDIGGGNCNFLAKLPENEVANGVSFDILATPISDNNWTKVDVESYFTTSGPYLDECGYNTRSCNDNMYIYLYRMPNIPSNIFQFSVNSESTVTGKIDGDRNDDLYMTLRSGFLNKPYPLNFVVECDNKISSECPDNFLIKSYLNDGKRDYSTSGSSLVLGGFARQHVDGEDRIESLKLVTNKVYDGSSLPKDKRVIVITKNFKEYGRTAKTKIFPDPNVSVSFKEQHYITNLKVLIGDSLFKIYPEINEGKIYLPDMSQEINDYCGRNLGINRECLVQIKFFSDDGGKISITSELGGLIPVNNVELENNQTNETIKNDFDFSNSVIGWVTFNYNDNPKNTKITISVVLIVIGLFSYLLWRRKK